MGPHIYVLGLSLSLRLNSEQLIYIIPGLSLSCRSNSEKRTKFKITADTLVTFARNFLPKKETGRVVIMLFKVMSVFLSMVLENPVTQSPHNRRYKNLFIH